MKKHMGILLAALLVACLSVGASAMVVDPGGEPLSEAMPDTAADRAGISLLAVLDDGVGMQNIDTGMRREMLRWYLSALCVGENSRVAAIPFQLMIEGGATQWSPLTSAADQRAWMHTPVKRIDGRDRAKINQGITDSLIYAAQMLAESAGETETLDVLLLSVSYWDELAACMRNERIHSLADARFAVMTASPDHYDEAKAEIGEMADVLLAMQTEKLSQDEVLAFLTRTREAVEERLPGIYTTRRIPLVQDVETGAWGVAIDLSNPALRGADVISDVLPAAAANDVKITLSAPHEDAEPVSLSARTDVMSYQNKGDRILVHWDRETMGTGVWQLSLGRLEPPTDFGAELVLYYAPVEMAVNEAPETIRRGEPLTISAGVYRDGSPVRAEDLPEGAVAQASVNEMAQLPMTLADDGETWTVTIPPDAMRTGMGLQENTARLHVSVAGSDEPLAETLLDFMVENHAPASIARDITERIVLELDADMEEAETPRNPWMISFRPGDAAIEARALSWAVDSLFFDEDHDTGDVVAFDRVALRRIDAAGNTIASEEISAAQGSGDLVVFQPLTREEARYEIEVFARDLAGAEASATLSVEVEDRAGDLAALWYEPALSGVHALSPGAFSCAKTDQPVIAVAQGSLQTRFTPEQAERILAEAVLGIDITGSDGERWTERGTAVEDASQKRFLLPVPAREGLYTYALSLQTGQGQPLLWPDGEAAYVFSLRVDNARPELIGEAWPAGQNPQGHAEPWVAVVETEPFLGYSMYAGEVVTVRPQALFADADQDALTYHIASADASQKPFVIDVDTEAGMVYLRGANGDADMPPLAATALDGARAWTITTEETRGFAVMLFASDSDGAVDAASPEDVSHGVIRVEGKSTARFLIRAVSIALLVIALLVIALLIIRWARKPSFGGKEAQALLFAVERDGARHAESQDGYTVPLKGYGKRDITLELPLHCLPLTGVFIEPDRAKRIVLRPTGEGIAVRDDAGGVSSDGVQTKGKWMLLTREGRIRVSGMGGALIIRLGGNEHGARW